MNNNITNTDFELYRLLFESSPDAVFISDISGRIYDANVAAEEMLGWSKEEICIIGSEGIFDSSHQNLPFWKEQRIVSGKTSGELRFIRKDGNKLPVEVNGKVFQLQDGETRVCIIARDILEKKINQIFVKEASEFNKRILKAAPIGIAAYNCTGQCVTVNQYFAEIIGTTREEMLKQNFTRIESWRKYGLYEMANQVMDDGIEIKKEVHMITTFGKEVWLDTTFTSFISNNEPHLLMMVYNITERKNAEGLLKQSEEKFRTSVESMLYPFAIFQSIRDVDNKIVDFSLRYINKSGIYHAEKVAANISARNILEIFTLENHSEVFYELCITAETGKPLKKETVLYDKASDKEIIYALHLNAVKFNDGFAISCSDVTETKIIEQKLRELNENKNKFFSIIAHDLRSPFHSIMEISEYLAEDADQLTPEELKEFFQSSNQTVKTTFKLLEDLLQWASNQTGRISFNPITFNLNELITESLSIFSAAAKDKHININFNDNFNPNVFADRNMIDTIFRNLVSNAIKFTPISGEININICPSDDYVKISVEDTGVGISEANIEKIFKLGEKITTLGTNRERGSGLGLMLCKDFIEKNNGELSIESVRGNGSTFSFTVPVRAKM